MSRIASINGAIFPLESAVVPVVDRGFLYGDGVFETIRVYGGRPFLQDEHLARLERSAAALRIKLPVSLAELAREMRVATDAAQEPEAYVRITITRGAGAEASLVPPSGLRATRVIIVQPVRSPAREVYARGLRAITLAWDRGGERGPAGSAKLLSYATNILALDEAHARGADEVIFHDELRDLEGSQPEYRLHLQLTAEMGKFDFAALDDVVQDWKERSAWACGPPAMLDSAEEIWKKAGLAEELHTERFTIARTDKGGEGGTVTFALSDKSIEVDGATSLLEAGEKLGIQMPFGCRMGICQSCVLPLESGHVRDFRSGTEHDEGDRIQTCISAASGDCTLKI